MTTRSAFLSAEDQDGMLQSGMAESVDEIYERVDDILGELK